MTDGRRAAGDTYYTRKRKRREKREKRATITKRSLALLYCKGFWTRERCRAFLDTCRWIESEHLEPQYNVGEIARACRRLLRSAANEKRLNEYVRKRNTTVAGVPGSVSALRQR